MLTYILLPILIGILSGAVINFCISKMPRDKQLPKLQPLSVMLLTTSAAFASFQVSENSSEITAALVFILCATLIAITFIDFEFKIIPDKITLPGIIIGLILGVVSEFFYNLPIPFTQGVIDSLLGLTVGAGLPLLFVYLYYLLTKKVGFGMGDIKLLGLFGACLGWRAILPIFFISSILGSIFGIAYIIIAKKNRRTEIPFGPYLAIGAIIYLFMLIP